MLKVSWYLDMIISTPINFNTVCHFSSQILFKEKLKAIRSDTHLKFNFILHVDWVTPVACQYLTYVIIYVNVKGMYVPAAIYIPSLTHVTTTTYFTMLIISRVTSLTPVTCHLTNIYQRLHLPYYTDVAILVEVINATAKYPQIATCFPEHTMGHYRYLRRIYPELIPELNVCFSGFF